MLSKKLSRIRRCFVPRKGNRLVEVDYSAIEVRIASCYNLDPNLIQYVEDTDRDMHRDSAADLLKCDPQQVSKKLRYYAKNQFVFPQFYGSYYAECAANLWESFQGCGEEIDGDPVLKWLEQRGIHSRGDCDPERDPVSGTFESHVRAVERHFWQNRFPVYSRWKDRWYASYQEKGYVDTLTGFRIQGELGRNDVINYPIQGSAFHCLLWSLIRLQKELRRRKMESRIVGQIHDSIVGILSGVWRRN